MAQRNDWFETIAVASVYVLLLAPMVCIQRAMAVPVLPLVPVFDGPPTYEDSPHGDTIDELWDTTDPALIEIVDPDENGSGEVAVHTDSAIAAGTWEQADSVVFHTELETFQDESEQDIGEYTLQLSFVAGTLEGADEATQVVSGIVQSISVEYYDSPGQIATLHTMFVHAQHGTVAAAVEDVDAMRTAEPYDPDDPSKNCLSAWTGNNGIQCCGFQAELSLRIKACWAEFRENIVLCAGGGLGIGAACFFGCLRWLGPLSVKGCLIACGIVALVAALGCITAKAFALQACIANAEANYINDLVENGCWPPPNQEM